MKALRDPGGFHGEEDADGVLCGTSSNGGGADGPYVSVNIACGVSP